MRNPFRYFKTSPEVIRLAVMMYVRFPVILEPIYCEGIEALKKQLHDLMPNRRRAVTILELTASAQAVATFMKEAPVIPRGRPKKTD